MGISKQLALFFLFLVTLSSGAQNYPPTFRAVKTSAGHFADGHVTQIAGDPFGNTYWAGHYLGSTFSLGSMILTNESDSQEAFQGFLFKFGPGLEGIWAKGSSNGLSQEVAGLAVDAAGNVHFAISAWNGVFDFDGLSYTSPSNRFTVVLKYSPDGERIWGHPIHGLNTRYNWRILDVDHNSNVFVAGLTEDDRSFVRKLNANGDDIWTHRGPTISANYMFPEHNFVVRSDSNGNCFFLCSFTNETASFGSTTLTNTGAKNYAFVKYDADGNVLWAERGGGSSFYSPPDCGIDFAIDMSGNSYVLSQISSTNAIFGDLSFQIEPSCFLTKYSPGGQVLWAKSLPMSYAFEIGGVHIIPTGNILLAVNGHNSGENGFDSPMSGSYLAECTQDGELLWKKRVRVEPQIPAEGSQKGVAVFSSRIIPGNENNFYVAGLDGNGYRSYLGLDSFSLTPPAGTFIAMLSFDPTLSISKDGNLVTLSWPTNEPGFTLESAAVIAEPMGWTPVTNSVALINGKNVVTGLAAEIARFYRLQKTLP